MSDSVKDVTGDDADKDVRLREEIARVILAQQVPCEEHPMPAPGPSCWLCARNGAFHRAALIALGRWARHDGRRLGHLNGPVTFYGFSNKLRVLLEVHDAATVRRLTMPD